MLDELAKAFARLGEDGLSSPDEISQNLPSECTVKDVAAEVAKHQSESSGDVGFLKAVQVCLGSGKLAAINEEDYSEDLALIAGYVARSILPAGGASNDQELDEIYWNKPTIRGKIGLKTLRLIHEEWKLKLDPQVLLPTTAFVNANDPWTTKESSVIARELLRSHLDNDNGANGTRTNFIVETVLNGLLRPLISKSRPATVTASGRKAEFVEKPRYDGGTSLSASDAETKPWKHQHRYAITVFEWAVSQADEELLGKHWHMFTPVLLTLLDEAQTDVKIRAFGIFRAFWARCPANLMQKVGLAEVFEQAIFPALLYLPSLTPEAESIKILNAAYPSLFQIAGLPYPEEHIGEPSKYPDFTDAEKKLFNKIIREGILVGYHHAGEHIRLTELFLTKSQCIINGMGILAVKHLKDIIPMLSEVMTDPFGINYPPALQAGSKLLQTILRCCWPRIPAYCNEIVKILTVCWLNVEEADAFTSGPITKESLKTELTKTATILAAVMKADEINLPDLVSPLIEKEALLASLFTVETSVQELKRRTELSNVSLSGVSSNGSGSPDS